MTLLFFAALVDCTSSLSRMGFAAEPSVPTAVSRLITYRRSGLACLMYSKDGLAVAAVNLDVGGGGYAQDIVDDPEPRARAVGGDFAAGGQDDEAFSGICSLGLGLGNGGVHRGELHLDL